VSSRHSLPFFSSKTQEESHRMIRKRQRQRKKRFSHPSRYKYKYIYSCPASSLFSLLSSRKKSLMKKKRKRKRKTRKLSKLISSSNGKLKDMIFTLTRELAIKNMKISFETNPVLRLLFHQLMLFPSFVFIFSRKKK